jgi:nitroreductase/NAD-dependent dihydropyrimidine dehydrogenase PreA subunit
MQNSVTTSIDEESCIGCGLCVEVCPAGTISMQDGKAKVTGTYSMGCGHCEAVCPVDAVRVESLEHPFILNSVGVDDSWLPHGDYDAAQLVRLMRSRRSCRNYLEQEVEKPVLEDLVRIGTTAPSGTNRQLWTFTILATRKEVAFLGEQVGLFFERLNGMAVRPLFRMYSRLFGGDALGNYYRRYFETVRDGLRRWRDTGEDTLFHGATAAILVGGSSEASTPMEDALLASQNIMLAAHSLGLGSCMIGFAVEAIKRDGKIRKHLGLTENESVYSVIVLGFPAEQYDKAALRRRVVPRYPEFIKK